MKEEINNEKIKHNKFQAVQLHTSTAEEDIYFF